jgi:GNAT superfamily N-acetyltransferase
MLNGFDLARFSAFWSHMLTTRLGCLIVQTGDEDLDVQGAIGGLLYPDPYSGEMIATEMFWFVRSAHRGEGMKLYREFERWAIAQGAQRIRMVHLADSMPDRLSVLYRRLGYRLAETVWEKEI